MEKKTQAKTVLDRKTILYRRNLNLDQMDEAIEKGPN